MIGIFGGFPLINDNATIKAITMRYEDAWIIYVCSNSSSLQNRCEYAWYAWNMNKDNIKTGFRYALPMTINKAGWYTIRCWYSQNKADRRLRRRRFFVPHTYWKEMALVAVAVPYYIYIDTKIKNRDTDNTYRYPRLSSLNSLSRQGRISSVPLCLRRVHIR